MGRLAHALHATGEDDIGLAEQDQLAAADSGLDAGAAQPVDGQGRNFDRQAGFQSNVPCAVDRVGAGLEHVPEDDVIDRFGLHTGALERRA